MLRNVINRHQKQIQQIVEIIDDEATKTLDRKLTKEECANTARDITTEAFEKLIAGFIRHITQHIPDFKQRVSKTHLSSIERLCLTFYNTGFEDVRFFIYNTQISQALYGQLLKAHSKSEYIKCHRLFLSREGFNFGVHKWKLQYVMSGGCEYGGIGVCTNKDNIHRKYNEKNNNHSNNNHNDNNNESGDTDSEDEDVHKQPWISNRICGNVYYLCQQMGRVYNYNQGKGRTVDKCLPNSNSIYKVDDIITVILDCNLWTIKFLLNDENICTNENGINILPATYYPIVAFFHWKDIIRTVTQ